MTRMEIVLGELLQEIVGKLQNHHQGYSLEKRFHCGINVKRVVVDAVVRGGRQTRVTKLILLVVFYQFKIFFGFLSTKGNICYCAVIYPCPCSVPNL